MITLEDLRNATGGQLFGDAAAEQFKGFCHEPDSARPGLLFVALPMPGSDTRGAVEQAVLSGASGVLCQQPPDCDVSGVTVILVGDTVAAVGQWAAYVLRQYGTTVIGVAGGSDKGTAVAAIGSVLATGYTVYANPAVLPGRAGLALGLGSLEPTHQIAVVGLESARLGEMPELLAMLSPQVAVVTDLSPSWIPQANQDAREAGEIIRALPAQGVAILNANDRNLRMLLADVRSGLLTFGYGEECEDDDVNLRAHNVKFFEDKVGFDLTHRSERLKGCWAPILGEPGLCAALSALAIGTLFDVPITEGLRALKGIRALPGRLSMLDAVAGAALIDNTYNATGASMAAALRLLGAIHMEAGRRICVLGDIAARAQDVKEIHRRIGQQVATVADLLVTCGDLAALAGRVAGEAGLSSSQIVPLYRHDDVIALLRDLLGPEDLVLVAGGRQARMERVVAGLAVSASHPDLLAPEAYRFAPPSSTPLCWVELNLDALANNLRLIRKRIGPNRSLIAMVRANAYGHGAVPVAATALRAGADMLGVSSIEEGLELRRAGIAGPIVIFGHTPPSRSEEVILSDLRVTLFDRDAAQTLAQTARELQGMARVHLPVDTGAGEMGLLPHEAVLLVRELAHLEGLEIDGLYTELVAAENLLESAVTQAQLSRFQALYESLRAASLSIPYVHAANSAAVLTLPASYFTAVRVGLALYGLHPSLDVPCPTGFRRVLSWKAIVSQVRTLIDEPPLREGVPSTSARGGRRVAIIAAGFSAGLRASPRTWGEVLVRGQRASIVGRIKMDRLVVDVSHLPEVRPGDEVVLIGRQGHEEISAEDVARRLDTSNDEVVTNISPRIPRIVTGDWT